MKSKRMKMRARNATITQMHDEGLFTFREIAEYLNLKSPATVFEAYKRAKQEHPLDK